MKTPENAVFARLKAKDIPGKGSEKSVKPFCGNCAYPFVLRRRSANNPLEVTICQGYRLITGAQAIKRVIRDE